jgi:hypothetical protein
MSCRASRLSKLDDDGVRLRDFMEITFLTAQPATCARFFPAAPTRNGAAL